MGFPIRQRAIHYPAVKKVNADGDPDISYPKAYWAPCHAYYLTAGQSYWEDGQRYAVRWEAELLLPINTPYVTPESRFSLPGIEGMFRLEDGLPNLDAGAPHWAPQLMTLKLFRVG